MLRKGHQVFIKTDDWFAEHKISETEDNITYKYNGFEFYIPKLAFNLRQYKLIVKSIKKSKVRIETVYQDKKVSFELDYCVFVDANEIIKKKLGEFINEEPKSI